MRRGFNLLHTRVEVRDRVGKELGHFRSNLASDGTELGKVTKKWAGLGKELFTSADNYVIALEESKTQLPEAGPLLLAAGLAIDIVYKEK